MSPPAPASLLQPYRGRFAPSPTGELHMGSLVAAVASYLEARVRDGEWLLRMEDLDPPREVRGSAGHILHTLERFGFEWNGPVLYQSTRTEAYEAALERLLQTDHAFPCACSRSEIRAAAAASGPEGAIYPGTCRNGIPAGRAARAVRFRTREKMVTCFEDRLQGRICQDVAAEIGDFVIRRADGYFAYQLAVVVDDAWQGVSDVVRGADLLLSTPRQRLLQQALDLPVPGYLHIPLLLDASGRKLSKQLRSLPVNAGQPAPALFKALQLLRQSPPESLRQAETSELWTWAACNWRPGELAGVGKLNDITD